MARKLYVFKAGRKPSPGRGDNRRDMTTISLPDFTFFELLKLCGQSLKQLRSMARESSAKLDACGPGISWSETVITQLYIDAKAFDAEMQAEADANNAAHAGGN